MALEMFREWTRERVARLSIEQLEWLLTNAMAAARQYPDAEIVVALTEEGVQIEIPSRAEYPVYAHTSYWGLAAAPAE